MVLSGVVKELLFVMICITTIEDDVVYNLFAAKIHCCVMM